MFYIYMGRVIINSKWPNWLFVPKSCALFWNLLKNSFPIFAIFSFLRYGLALRRIQKKKICWGLRPPKPLRFTRGFIPHTNHRGLRPQTPAAFGLYPPNQLIIRYHWLAFLNQVCKNSKSPIHYDCWVQNRPYLIN